MLGHPFGVVMFSNASVIVAGMTTKHVTTVTNPLTSEKYIFTSTVQYAYVRFILRDDGHVFASKHRTLRQASSSVNLTADLRDRPRTVVRIKDDKIVTNKLTRTSDLTSNQKTIKVQAMTSKTRPVTLTHPTTGETFQMNVGTKYNFVRFMLTDSDDGGPTSKHVTLDQAVSGPSQTTAWNKYPRVVVDLNTGEIVFDGRPSVPVDELPAFADCVLPIIETPQHVDNCGCKSNGDGFYTFMNSECAALRARNRQLVSA